MEVLEPPLHLRVLSLVGLAADKARVWRVGHATCSVSVETVEGGACNMQCECEPEIRVTVRSFWADNSDELLASLSRVALRCAASHCSGEPTRRPFTSVSREPFDLEC